MVMLGVTMNVDCHIVEQQKFLLRIPRCQRAAYQKASDTLLNWYAAIKRSYWLCKGCSSCASVSLF